MSLPVGYEYRLVDDQRIAGWKQWNLLKRPELANVPHSTPEMNQSLYDEYGYYRYRLVNGEIIDSPQPPTEHDIALQKINSTQLFKGFKALIAEIDSLRIIAGGDSEQPYVKLKNVIDKIQNGF